jgi:hypothetical protein
MNVKKNRKIVISILLFCVFISGCISSQDSGKGTLQLTSSPSGAEIYLDNQYRGSTPSTITDVVFGNHTLEYRYPGYQRWSTSITVSSGTSQFYASLTPQSNSQIPRDLSPPETSQNKVTVKASKDTMVIGTSISFSGTCVGSNSVLLTLYGPGYYSHGVLLDQPIVNSGGLWSYTWNPGSSLQSGSYTMVVNDAQKITSERTEFSVVGGGEVSISANSRSVSQGDSVIFSGRCTTNAPNVILVLYGPERYSSGVELGSISVMADKTWNFKYTLDKTMPTGYYSINVYDVPKTTSGSMQFTVGFSST